MKYHFLEGVSKQKKRSFKLPILLFFVGLVVAGGYVAFNAVSPAIHAEPAPGEKLTSQKLLEQKPGELGDRLYIPQINVDVSLATGDEKVLEAGAWHRKPENGNPLKGGNFVLSAHRFSMGLTPQQTRAASPFYHIDKLQVDDQIYVDYQGKRFAYKITHKYAVPPQATEIEAASKEPKLTLYSCDKRGEAAGREVIEAKPLGVVANGQIELNNTHTN